MCRHGARTRSRGYQAGRSVVLHCCVIEKDYLAGLETGGVARMVSAVS